MISFNYETEFRLLSEEKISNWVTRCIEEEHHRIEEINYVFCDDDYLFKLNVEFLNHDTLTDIISFDYSVGKLIQGDIFISIDTYHSKVAAKMINMGANMINDISAGKLDREMEAVIIKGTKSS